MRQRQYASCCGLFFGVCVFVLLTTPCIAQTFSLDAPTAPANGFLPDDLLLPGPGPLLLGAGGLAPGPLTPPPIEVDGFTFSQVFTVPHTVVGVDFSVSPASVGLPGTAVIAESGAGGDHPADGDGLPIGPALPFGVLEPLSNVDGWDATAPFGPAAFPGIYYTVPLADALAHPIYTGSGATGAYIFFSPPVTGYSVAPAVYATDAMIGLGPTDEIDALAIIEDGSMSPTAGDAIYFSLAPGSPMLGVLGASPADILVTSIGGAPVVFAPAASLGLATTDDIDALDLVVVPEPSSIALLFAGGAIILLRRRVPAQNRRRK